MFWPIMYTIALGFIAVEGFHGALHDLSMTKPDKSIIAFEAIVGLAAVGGLIYIWI